MDFIPVIIALVAGAGAGVGGFYVYNKRNENGGKNKADDLVRKAKHEASEIVLNGSLSVPLPERSTAQFTKYFIAIPP